MRQDLPFKSLLFTYSDHLFAFTIFQSFPSVIFSRLKAPFQPSGNFKFVFLAYCYCFLFHFWSLTFLRVIVSSADFLLISTPAPFEYRPLINYFKCCFFLQWLKLHLVIFMLILSLILGSFFYILLVIAPSLYCTNAEFHYYFIFNSFYLIAKVIIRLNLQFPCPCYLFSFKIQLFDNLEMFITPLICHYFLTITTSLITFAFFLVQLIFTGQTTLNFTILPFQAQINMNSVIAHSLVLDFSILPIIIPSFPILF